MRQRHRRILIYSHDSFGLGHLRRCRTIAHALVGAQPDLSVLILSGSPIIGSFGFRNRVDFVRIPGVIKLRHGDYEPLSLDIGIEETLHLRASIIQHTAETFAPDIFLVDKEPWGLRGEVRETLTMLKANGTPLILGLRDVMDEPRVLAEEWQRKNALPALADFYDELWVYGLPAVCNPLEGLPLPPGVLRKVRYTGYLRRSVSPVERPAHPLAALGGRPYILVTTGGGGDGAEVVDWVLQAYEHDAGIEHPALIVLGPFMRSADQAAFMERAGRLGDRVQAIVFDAHVESLMAASAGIIAMGGYNTFCEILSFDKPALIMPRSVPRAEQFIRASRGQSLGLVRMLAVDGDRDPAVMAAAIDALPHQPRPSSVEMPGLLDGLDVINGMINAMLRTNHGAPARKPAMTATL
ncbi:MAG: hypothetical protein EA406_03065 [Rhodospirillales bacterium]|nr:MAG: hypothetical protein EA406_03065 [Rhodospirillales bacterium]